MQRRLCPEQSLLIAELSAGGYANAFIFLNTIITAHHVARGTSRVVVPNTEEWGRFHFSPVGDQDLAFSQETIPTAGVERATIPNIGERVYVQGHHGPQREAYSTEAEVLEILPNRLIRIQYLSGKVFQPGMSGSLALTIEGTAVGTLVSEVSGTSGKQVLLEPLITSGDYSSRPR